LCYRPGAFGSIGHGREWADGWLFLGETMLNRISCFLRRNSHLLAALVFAFFTLAPVCQASSSARKEEKHVRKIEKKLAKFRKGTFLEVDLNDNTDARGSLVQLNDTTFQIFNADTNKAQTINYSDVDTVSKTKEYIGPGSEPSHHFHLHLP
jgi:hypothetical protein